NYRKETRNENRSIDRTSFTWADLCRVWHEWLFEFSQHGADAYGTGRSVHRRVVSLSLLLGGGSAPNRRRRATVSEPVRTARIGAAGAGNRGHHLLSRVSEAEWSSTGGGRGSPVDDGFLRSLAVLVCDSWEVWLMFEGMVNDG